MFKPSPFRFSLSKDWTTIGGKKCGSMRMRATSVIKFQVNREQQACLENCSSQLEEIDVRLTFDRSIEGSFVETIVNRMYLSRKILNMDVTFTRRPLQGKESSIECTKCCSRFSKASKFDRRISTRIQYVFFLFLFRFDENSSVFDLT